MRNTLFIVLAALLVSCNSNTLGTNTGNPMATPPKNQITAPTYAASLVDNLCGKINQCFDPINMTACQTQLIYTSRMTSELGPMASSYLTLAELAIAESSGQIQPVPSAFNSCIATLKQLDCGDPLMNQAYLSSNPANFLSAYIMLRSSPFCGQIY